MGLETGTYISDLNVSNPVGASDSVSQGDDHLRLIKTVLQNSINLTGQVTATFTELNYLDGVTGTTGTGNLVLSASPTLTGTITAAAANLSGALTALSYGGITEANLVDKSASETITGATWDFQAITAVSFGGIASADLVDKSATETITGTWNFAAITATTYDGIAAANLLDKSAAETITGAYNFNGTVTIDTLATDASALDTGSVAVTSDNDSADEIGWKGTPQNAKSSSYTLVLADAAKQIYLNGGVSQTLTVPANSSVAFPIGTIIPIINDSGNNWTIAITTDTMTEYVSGSTGSRTLATDGKAILEKVTATKWFVSGPGVS